MCTAGESNRVLLESVHIQHNGVTAPQQERIAGRYFDRPRQRTRGVEGLADVLAFVSLETDQRDLAATKAFT
jgi:hypothetical protein